MVLSAVFSVCHGGAGDALPSGRSWLWGDGFLLLPLPVSPQPRGDPRCPVCACVCVCVCASVACRGAEGFLGGHGANMGAPSSGHAPRQRLGVDRVWYIKHKSLRSLARWAAAARGAQAPGAAGPSCAGHDKLFDYFYYYSFFFFFFLQNKRQP